jgi:hypothetical protein
MPALLTQLIDKVDNSERIRDQIAAILAIESADQQLKAAAAGKDSRLWKLRVFVARSNAWELFQNPPDASDPDAEATYDSTPIVNVSFDQETFDKSKGDQHERQAADGTYFIDCFGLGISADDPNGLGHFAGDELAELEAHRAARLVRNITMAAEYITLGFPKKPNAVIWNRWVQSIQISPVPASERIAQHICGARVSLSVTFNEFSPQIEGAPLELISTSFKRADTGELFSPPTSRFPRSLRIVCLSTNPQLPALSASTPSM